MASWGSCPVLTPRLAPAPQGGEPRFPAGRSADMAASEPANVSVPARVTAYPPWAGLRSGTAGTPRPGAGQHSAEGRPGHPRSPWGPLQQPGHTRAPPRRPGLRAGQRHRLPCGGAGHLLRLSRESAEKARLGGQATALRAAWPGGTTAALYVLPRLPQMEASARKTRAELAGRAPPRASWRAPRARAEQPLPPPARPRRREEGPGGAGRWRGRGPIKGPAHGRAPYRRENRTGTGCR